ncbi:MAG TPA: response regulator transcription factor [Aggregatilineales bacterium]|nr:response regulator transcription factor [Anaerolineales bacterium]HRE47061.1 response regulator transcription factor [Aggregatilineales bacterium]
MVNPRTNTPHAVISVIVVDDHPILRGGLIKLLELEDDIMIAAEAGTGTAALTYLRLRPPHDQPDVMLLDINLPDLNGFEVATTMRTEGSRTAVVLLTAYDDPEQKLQALRMGAAAYCPKAIEPDRLVAVIRSVARGKKVIDDQVFDDAGVNAWIVAKTSSLPNDELTRQPLSPREMEILRLVTRGLSNKVIAQELKISHQTVRNHITSILYKLNAEGRTQAALYAIQRGWVRAQDYRPPAED